METSTWTGAKVYWVTSGRIIADGLTKASHKNPCSNLNLLRFVLEHGAIRITDCTESWREEMAKKKTGPLHEVDISDHTQWNPAEDVAFDIPSGAAVCQRRGSVDVGLSPSEGMKVLDFRYSFVTPALTDAHLAQVGRPSLLSLAGAPWFSCARPRS